MIYKRVVSFLLGCLFVFFLCVDCTPRVRAVSPPVILAAVSVASFLVSSGVELLWDDREATANSLVSDITTLWDEFRSSSSGVGVPALDGFPSDWVTYGGSSGYDIVLTYDAAQTYQDFVNWMSVNYDFKPHGVYNLTDNGSSATTAYTIDDTTGLEYINAGICSLPVYTIDSDVTFERGGTEYYLTVDSPTATICKLLVNNTDSWSPQWVYVAADYSPVTITRRYKSDGSDSGQYPSGNTPAQLNGNSWYYATYSESLSIPNDVAEESVNIATVDNWRAYRDLTYVVLFGYAIDSGSSGALLASLGASVADRVSSMVDTDTLVIGLGATSEDDVTDAVIDSLAGVRPLEVTETLVGVDGITELYPNSYPDIEGLTLSDLGNAFVRRFPFSIPWDVSSVLSSLRVRAEVPVFEVDLIPSALKQRIGLTADTSFTVDFSDSRYSIIIIIIRWSVMCGFLISLAFATKRLIWTTGG